MSTSDGNQAVQMPLNTRALVAMEPERVWRLRKHLVQSLRAMRTMRRPVESASPLRPEPDGFVGEVARAACAFCRGWCCKGGGDHGYLDERVMARVRQAQPALDARAVMRLYVERVPGAGYAGSCIFHGVEGCTLNRSLRSDVCNSYFCSGLGNFVKSSDTPTSAVVIAKQDGETRRSPLLRCAPGTAPIALQPPGTVSLR
ncbi:MAG TPA: hypothetical protein VKI44_38895 [Acetobacteraceae bacterium]|nr:hypothetical protein [Acetobacteraceae bacterium]